MSLLSAFAVAIALAMDAFAVSLSASATLGRVNVGHYFRMALTFGFFQFAMPVIGWLLGLSVKDWIEAWDHWIAFGVLFFVGMNMLREAFFGDDEEECQGDPSRGATLILLAVATSIDALAIGVTFAFLGVNIWSAVLFIGLTTALFSGTGVYIGNIFGNRYKSKAEFAGGFILVVMGVKTLLDHTGVF